MGRVQVNLRVREPRRFFVPLRRCFVELLSFGFPIALGMTDDQAHVIQLDVRKRDEERLAIQAAEGIYAGGEKWHTRPVTPEPLIKPPRESRRIDKVSERDT